MAKRRQEEEEWEPSVRTADAIQLYWPESMTPSHPFFERSMIELQLAMLEGHRRTMFKSDRERALKTVRELKSKLGRLGVRA